MIQGRYTEWANEDAFAAIRKWTRRAGEPPRYNEWRDSEEFPSVRQLERRFGTFNRAIRLAGEVPRQQGGTQHQCDYGHALDDESDYYAHRDKDGYTRRTCRRCMWVRNFCYRVGIIYSGHEAESLRKDRQIRELLTSVLNRLEPNGPGFNGPRIKGVDMITEAELQNIQSRALTKSDQNMDRAERDGRADVVGRAIRTNQVVVGQTLKYADRFLTA